ncbi:MAG: hypothetical protein BJ554DRAFT_3545, partial [Olpidium bornovanus]
EGARRGVRARQHCGKTKNQSASTRSRPPRTVACAGPPPAPAGPPDGGGAGERQPGRAVLCRPVEAEATRQNETAGCRRGALAGRRDAAQATAATPAEHAVRARDATLGVWRLVERIHLTHSRLAKRRLRERREPASERSAVRSLVIAREAVAATGADSRVVSSNAGRRTPGGRTSFAAERRCVDPTRCADASETPNANGSFGDSQYSPAVAESGTGNRPPVRDAAPTAAGPSTGLLMGPASPSPTDAPPVVVNESEAEHNVEGRSSEEKANLRNAATFGVFGALVLLGFVAAALYLAVRQKRARRGAAAKFAPPPHLAAARPPLPSYNGTAAGWWMTVMEGNRGRNDRQTTPGTVPNGANSPQHVLGPRPRLNETAEEQRRFYYRRSQITTAAASDEPNLLERERKAVGRVGRRTCSISSFVLSYLFIFFSFFTFSFLPPLVPPIPDCTSASPTTGNEIEGIRKDSCISIAPTFVLSFSVFLWAWPSFVNIPFPLSHTFIKKAQCTFQTSGQPSHGFWADAGSSSP